MTNEEILDAHIDRIDDTAYKIMVQGKRKFLLELMRAVRWDEKEACAAILDRAGDSVGDHSPLNTYNGGYRAACDSNAAAIRNRKDKP